MVSPFDNKSLVIKTPDYLTFSSKENTQTKLIQALVQCPLQCRYTYRNQLKTYRNYTYRDFLDCLGVHLKNSKTGYRSNVCIIFIEAIHAFGNVA